MAEVVKQWTPAVMAQEIAAHEKTIAFQKKQIEILQIAVTKLQKEK